MALTEEQKERVMINREKALEVKRRKAEERAARGGGENLEGVGLTPPDGCPAASGRQKNKNGGEGNAREDGDGENGTLVQTDLEDFEVGASQYVTREEAMKKYCLPHGTLAVCSYVEKPNPRNKGWAPMRLYEREEIRRRARERFGGLEGLIEERRKRYRRRLAKDMEETRDVFKRIKS